MRLEKCYFCSSTVYPGHGIQFVRNDCKIFKFCRPKCHRAFKKKKNPRRTKWTKAARKTLGKELTQDPVLELEKKRDEPQKYSRQLWNNTVEAVKKITEIKEKREKLHIKNRLKKGKALRKSKAITNLQKNISLLRSPAAELRQKAAVQTPQSSKAKKQKEELMEEN